MKKLTNLWKIAIILLSIGLISSCASFATASLPSWENRTWDFTNEGPWIIYQYPVCVRKFLGICTKHEKQKEKMDLTDPVVRARLVDANFMASARRQR